MAWTREQLAASAALLRAPVPRVLVARHVRVDQVARGGKAAVLSAVLGIMVVLGLLAIPVCGLFGLGAMFCGAGERRPPPPPLWA